MAQPTPYNRVTSFSSFQAVNPTSPLPASSVDQEYNAIKTTLDQTLNNLALIQRDDGYLANGSVGLDQLSAEVTVGFTVPTVWLTATAYTADVSTVFHGAAFYRCLVSHTSGTFSTDLAGGKWQEIVDLSGIPLTSAAQVAVTPAGNISSTDVQAALSELDSEKAAVSHSHLASAISDSTSAGRSILTAADIAAIKTLLGLTYGAPNYGDMLATAAVVAPSGWLLCYGQAISRTTYASLFSAITIQQSGARTNGSPVITGLSDTSNMRAGMPVSGTGIPSSTTITTVDSGTQITLSQNATSSGTNTIVVAPYGVGDGSTTFNVPDRRGRVSVGRDDMGGTAASRMTTAGAGIDGLRLGAVGGAQTHTLTTAQLASHTHSDGTLATTNPTTVARDGWTTTGNAPSPGTSIASGRLVVGSGAIESGETLESIRAAGADMTLTGSTAADVSGATGSNGSGDAHNNTQPSGIDNWIIFAGV